MSRIAITRRSFRLALLAALAATALLVVTVASATASGSVQVLKLSVKGTQLKFTTDSLKAHPGTVKIEMSNPKDSGISHGIAITGPGVNRSGAIVPPGKTSVVTVTVKKGKYTYFCPVPGHEMAGMKGTLTVS